MRALLAAGLACILPTVAAADTLQSRLDALGASQCAESELVCVTLDVPRDHFANDLTNTIPMTFAVHTAWSGQSNGVLVVAVGGPGYSGLRAADSYLDSFGPAVFDEMDIVFFDQRGVGSAAGLDCPLSQSAFDSAEKPRGDADATIALTRSYVGSCFLELGFASLAPYAGTVQVIRDLDYFRRAAGVDKLWLYGESYGTQVAQEYAVEFPDNVAGIVLDGVVDLELSLTGFNDTYTSEAADLLRRVFAACDQSADCRRDMGDSAGSAYEQLYTTLQSGPVTVSHAFDGETVEDRQLTIGMLETNAFLALYEPYTRVEFLRALALARRGDHVPMLQLAYLNQSLESDTLASVDDPDWFGAAYNAITCADYADETAGDPARAEAVARAALIDADRISVTEPWFADQRYLDRVVCAFWPATGRAERPRTFVGSRDYPTLILNSDADPITPLSMARTVFDRTENASLVVMEGGPHVIYARGLECPDVIVERFLLGELPEAKVQLCRQDLIGDYVPLTLTDADDRSDPMRVAQSLQIELAESITLKNWDAVSERTFGCAHGGTFIAQPGQHQSMSYEFADCGIWPELALTGFAAETDQDDSDVGFWANVTASGSVSGTIVFVENKTTGARRISGTWAGIPIGQ